MPCLCCGASRPSKGLEKPIEQKINGLLIQASQLILSVDCDNDFGDKESEWKKGWKEAFDHHLNGCDEK